MKNYAECEDFMSKRGLKRYYDSKEKTSNKRIIYYGKKININFFRNKKIDKNNLLKQLEPVLN